MSWEEDDQESKSGGKKKWISNRTEKGGDIIEDFIYENKTIVNTSSWVLHAAREAEYDDWQQRRAIYYDTVYFRALCNNPITDGMVYSGEPRETKYGNRCRTCLKMINELIS